MTTMTPPDLAADTTASVSSPVAVGSALLTIGSLGYIGAGVLTGGEAGREGFLHPLNAPSSGLAALGATILALSLARWTPAGLPRWAVRLAAAGMVGVAICAWWSATFAVALVRMVTDNATFLDGAMDPWALLGMAPKVVLLVALPVLAVAGWRTREFPRWVCVVLVLAGILSLWPPFPPGSILAAIALFGISRRHMRA